MKVDKTLLLSGEDIPFESARLTIHNPSIKELSYYGEENFHIGSQFLVFTKNRLDDKDKKGLENQSDFNIFIAVMRSPLKADHKTAAKKLLNVLFPNAEIEIGQNQILVKNENIAVINESNFDDFRDIINQMFCLNIQVNEGVYNPRDAYAKRIADKLAKRHEKLKDMKGEKNDFNIYSQYASTLAIGLKVDLNIIMNYTVYQLRDQMKRFTLKQDSDIYLDAKLAGVQDLDEVENWMGDIHKNE